MVDVALNYLEKKYYYRISTNGGKNPFGINIYISQL